MLRGFVLNDDFKPRLPESGATSRTRPVIQAQAAVCRTVA